MPSPNGKPNPAGDRRRDDATRIDPGIDWKPPVPFGAQHGPEFPTEVLPEWLRNYVEALALFTQTPAGLSGGLALVLLAVALHKAYQVQPRQGWVEPVNLYWLGLADPASRKSAVAQAMRGPLDEFVQVEVEKMRPEIRQKQTKFQILEKQKSEYINSIAKAKDAQEREHLLRQVAEIAEEIAANPVPCEPQRIAQDVTPERLATLMVHNDCRMGILDTEGDYLEIIAGRYSSKGQSNTGLILKGWSGDPHRVDRGNRPSEFLHQPLITLGIVAQPAVFDAMSSQPGFRGKGVLARFLYDKAESRLGRREINPPEVPYDVEDVYRRTMLAILRMPVNRNANNEIEPMTLFLSENAKKQFCEFREWIEKELGEFGVLSTLPDWGGKIAGQTARIAGLLHVADCVGGGQEVNDEVSEGTMKRAIQLGNYYISHSRVMFSLIGTDNGIAESKYLLKVIRRNTLFSFSKRDLFEKTKGTFNKADDLDNPLKVLESHGYILETSSPPSGKAGRRPSPTYAVNPFLENDSHNSQKPGAA